MACHVTIPRYVCNIMASARMLYVPNFIRSYRDPLKGLIGTYIIVRLMVGLLDFGSIWPIGGSGVVQRAPTGLFKVLPTRQANSETFCF